ncbi:MAG: DUF2807 domain-containing protein [Pseudomonadota bacterium]
MKKVLTLCVASAMAAACSGTPPVERAPGETFYETKNLPIEAAEAVAVRGPFKVTVFGTADAPEVTLMGPPEMIADTLVEVQESTVSIRFVEGAEWSWNTGAGMHALVNLPSLNSVALQGSGSIKVYGAKAASFEAGTGGSGSITITGLEADNVELGVGGSGSVSAQGTATNASYGVGGSGIVDAKRLRVATAQIGIGGSGSIYADVSESAEIGVGGAGKVEVVGGAECTFEQPQAGQIECR